MLNVNNRMKFAKKFYRYKFRDMSFSNFLGL